MFRKDCFLVNIYYLFHNDQEVMEISFQGRIGRLKWSLGGEGSIDKQKQKGLLTLKIF